MAIQQLPYAPVARTARQLCAGTMLRPVHLIKHITQTATHFHHKQCNAAVSNAPESHATSMWKIRDKGKDTPDANLQSSMFGRFSHLTTIGLCFTPIVPLRALSEFGSRLCEAASIGRTEEVHSLLRAGEKRRHTAKAGGSVTDFVCVYVTRVHRRRRECQRFRRVDSHALCCFQRSRRGGAGAAHCR